MANKNYDCIVIGSGPGGEVGAIRAAQLGLKTAIIEKSPYFGGTCLNVGCIPTKSLLGSAATYKKLLAAKDQGFETGKVSFDWSKIMDRKAEIVEGGRKGLSYLFKKNKIDVYNGVGKFKTKNEIVIQNNSGSETISGKNILIATGSKVRLLKHLQPNHRNILTSDSILSIGHVPKSLCIIGGGVVGMEFASLFARFGSDVTVIELGKQILPSEDADVVKEAEKQFKKDGIKIHCEAGVTNLKAEAKSVTMEYEKKGKKQTEKFECVLLSIGRAPVTEDLNLAKLGIAMDGEWIKANEHYQTSLANIFAIGDVIKTPALAHTASAEAIHAVEIMAGHKPHIIDYDTNPNAIYTYPEVASVGKTERQLKEEKVAYKVAKFPFSPMAKAKIDDATIGFVKLVYGEKYGELLGAHIVGVKATEMISEFVVGKVLETTVDELAMSIHPHPTLSEVSMEAAHAAVGGAIHM